jgi:hypothetical protein
LVFRHSLSDPGSIELQLALRSEALVVGAITLKVEKARLPRFYVRYCLPQLVLAAQVDKAQRTKRLGEPRGVAGSIRIQTAQSAPEGREAVLLGTKSEDGCLAFPGSMCGGENRARVGHLIGYGGYSQPFAPTF